MIYLLAVLAASIAGELLLTFRPVWRYRRTIALGCLLVMSFSIAGLWTQSAGFWTLLLTVTAAYRAVNLSRVLEDRMHEMFARHAVRQTAAWLGGVQLLALSGQLIGDGDGSGIGLHAFMYMLAVAQAIVAIAAFLSLRRQLARTTPSHEAVRTPDSRLPSVTVAIPARNEDAQMEACLTAVMASDYPKLEVIVLDDCSADKTPDIIRSFAHAGVRFIRGSEPHDGWLAKNQAYDRLYKEASGTLILFCGVDVRLERGSIRQLVANLQQRDKVMLSVLPRNPLAVRLPLVQAMRYYWEMVPPRRLFSRPPVLSSCWMARRDFLRKLGGFNGVRRSITPEAHFARHAIVRDGYSFIRSDAKLGVTSEKPALDQTETAIQTRYPQLHRRPELVLAVALAEVLVLAGPLAVLSYGLYIMHPVLAGAAVATLAVQTYIFAHLQHAVFPHSRWQAELCFLPAVISDVIMLHLSMYKYEFSEVYWRGRNVCYPVMHIVPRLPNTTK